MGSNPTRGDKIFTYIYIFISSLWCQGKVRRWFPPFNTQCLQNSAKIGERSVLTLGALCLPCCVRDTAWSWFDFILMYLKLKQKSYTLVVSIRASRKIHLADFYEAVPDIPSCELRIRKLNLPFYMQIKAENIYVFLYFCKFIEAST